MGAPGAHAARAVYPDARNAWAFPELLDDEGLEPHTVREVYLMAREEPDRFVDITDTIERKVEALLSHRSQVGDHEQADGAHALRQVDQPPHHHPGRATALTLAIGLVAVSAWGAVLGERAADEVLVAHAHIAGGRASSR